jgi:hypothetical protein
VCAFASALALTAPQPASAAPVFTEFRATLLQLNEISGVPFTGAYGSAAMQFNPSTRQLTYDVRVTGIPSATMAHIHQGLIGVNGPVIFDLLAMGGGTLDPATPISGTSPISPAQVTTLLAGDYYVNVHTIANPTGELRGQLGANEVFLQAPLNGANEAPPVATPATGLASFDLAQASGKMSFEVSVTGIPSATMAHIHRGPAGVNGPVVFDLLAAGGGTLNSFTSLRGSLSLTATQVISTLNAGYYANVHTVVHPGGEIRGQIVPPQQFLTYQSNLNGANELPTPITTTATGVASLVFDTASNELTYQILTENITPTMMHIHTGTITETGGIAFDLGLSGSGVVTLTTDQAYLMAAGGYYINVHTAANPNGEIRGQIYPAAVQSMFFAPLGGIGSSAASVNPEGVSPITGLAFFQLDPNQTQLLYSFTTSKPVSVTLATLNRGAPGVIGPVVTAIFSGTASAGPNLPLTGIGPLTPAALNDLLLNSAYIEIQTNPALLFPIRGDILRQQRQLTPLVANQ